MSSISNFALNEIDDEATKNAELRIENGEEEEEEEVSHSLLLSFNT